LGSQHGSAKGDRMADLQNCAAKEGKEIAEVVARLRENEVSMFNMRIGVAGILLVARSEGPASADGLKISGLSASGFGKQNLCSGLGGASVPPTFTVRHSKGSGSITVSMQDNVSNGNIINHGSTTVPASPSGVTVVKYSFMPPCNLGSSISTYVVTATADGSSQTIIWGKYSR